MDYQHGSRARFFYHSLDMSAYAEQVEQQLNRALAEYRPLIGTGVIRVPGHRDASLTLSAGAFTSASDLWTWQRFEEEGSRPWTLLPRGNVFGYPCYVGLSFGQNQQRVVGDDVIRLPVSKVTTEDIYRGVVLHPLGPAGVSPGPEYDSGAPSNDGLTAVLHCTAMGGTDPELTVSIQHDDGIAGTWDPVLTFTTLLLPGSQIITIPGPLAVLRHVRVAWTLIDTLPTADFFVGFVRH